MCPYNQIKYLYVCSELEYLFYTTNFDRFKCDQYIKQIVLNKINGQNNIMVAEIQDYFNN